MDSKTESLKAELKRLHVETAERVVCRRLDALVGWQPWRDCNVRCQTDKLFCSRAFVNCTANDMLTVSGGRKETRE
jgi:hypothetical protein